MHESPGAATRRLPRLTQMAAVLGMVVVLLPGGVGGSAGAQSAEALREEAEAVERALQDAEASQGQVEAELQDAAGDRQAVETDLATATAAVDEVLTQLDAVEAEQAGLRAEVGRLTEEAAAGRELLGARVRALYMQGGADDLVMAFSAEAVADVNLRSHYLLALSRDDRSEIEQLEVVTTILAGRQDELAQVDEQLGDLRAEAESRQTELDRQLFVAAGVEAGVAEELAAAETEARQLAFAAEEATLAVAQAEEADRQAAIAAAQEAERLAAEAAAAAAEATALAQANARAVFAEAAEAPPAEVADPEVADPEVADPEVDDPEAADPGVADPGVDDPEVADPEVADPEVADPEVEVPEVEAAPQDGAGPAAEEDAPAGNDGEAVPAPAPPAVSSGAMACPQDNPRSFTDTWGAPRSGGRSHQGTDIFGTRGGNVFAITDGTVTRTSNGNLSGLMLTMRGDDGNDYWYMHLQDFVASAGQRVSAGELIGHNGDTGNARGTSPHIHFEHHPGGGGAVNPYPLLASIC